MKTAEKYYMAVVEEQGISEAARKLYITQQSLSEQMQKLEQQYEMEKRQAYLRGYAFLRTVWILP